MGSIFLTNVRREDRAWSLETAGIEVRIFCQGSLNRVRAKLAYDSSCSSPHVGQKFL